MMRKLLLAVIGWSIMACLVADVAVPGVQRRYYRVSPNQTYSYIVHESLSLPIRYYHIRILGDKFRIEDITPNEFRIRYNAPHLTEGVAEKHYLGRTSEVLTIYVGSWQDKKELEDKGIDFTNADNMTDPYTRLLPAPDVQGFDSITDYYYLADGLLNAEDFKLVLTKRIYELDNLEITAFSNFDLVPGFIKTRMKDSRHEFRILPGREVRALVRHIKDDPNHQVNTELSGVKDVIRQIRHLPLTRIERLQARYPVPGAILVILAGIAFLFFMIWVKTVIFKVLYQRYKPPIPMELPLKSLYWLTARLFLVNSLLGLFLSLLIYFADAFLILIPIAVSTLETIVYAGALGGNRSRCLAASLISNMLCLVLIASLIALLMI